MSLGSAAWSIRWFVFAAAVALLPVVADAQQPTANSLRLAREIIDVKGTAKIMEPVVAEVIDRSTGALAQTNPTLSKQLNDVALKIKEDSGPKLGELLNEVAKMYAAAFTEQELKDILAFYKSPAGQKVIIQEPAVLDRSVNFAETWADRYSSEVLTQIRAEMKKRGVNNL